MLVTSVKGMSFPFGDKIKCELKVLIFIVSKLFLTMISISSSPLKNLVTDTPSNIALIFFAK